MREEELKYRVSDRRALDALAALLGAPARVERQRNWYFDTPELDLQGRGALVRLRVLDGAERAVLAVKIAERIEAGLIVADEEERELTAAETAALRADPGGFLAALSMPLARKALAGIAAARLACTGELRTHRRCYALPAGLLALDAVAFPGGDEFEIELETADSGAGRAFVENLCARAGIAAWKEAEPKSARLFRRRAPSVE
ncbi:MAG TPA: CYTH domain-containing protein [Planctomycetota bacterium]|jgi:uncharacterized protein YjbK|nr:CYTH domain-containing protein [Planctomycetota bacterium]OQC22239.1 MAG: CYTH domain protein [Planctomycetes bacterium ADurb.Bin069]HNS00598.1 CYTH domain-containing protein [Planctomycetota bacterium]HNU25926.1 CYTH domain-containing protein [Planctomycetota bacterium]HOE29310.1 CYTH domain-containing protein [Planctomycetota bacterium]